MFRTACLLQRLPRQTSLIQSQTSAKKTLKSLFGINLIRKAGTSPTIEKEPDGVEYDIALKKFQAESPKKTRGWNEDDPLEDEWKHMEMLLLCGTFLVGFIPVFYFYTPMGSGAEKDWYRREARKLLEERLEKGLPPIDINYAPKDMIEQMVPPPGDWERDWLRQQPTWKNPHRPNWRMESVQSLKHAYYMFR